MQSIAVAMTQLVLDKRPAKSYLPRIDAVEGMFYHNVLWTDPTSIGAMHTLAGAHG